MEDPRLPEHRARAKARRNGYTVTKSRAGISVDNHGQFMLVDDRNHVVLGDRYDASIEEIDQYLDERLAEELAS
jgi:hypothetical protein